MEMDISLLNKMEKIIVILEKDSPAQHVLNQSNIPFPRLQKWSMTEQKQMRLSPEINSQWNGIMDEMNGQTNKERKKDN